MSRWLAWALLLLLWAVGTVAFAGPTTREAEDLLKTKGLARVGGFYLLEVDQKLDDQVAVVRKAQAQMNASRRVRAGIEQDVRRAEDSAIQWAHDIEDLDRQMSRTKNARDYNELVGRVNALATRIEEAKRFVKTREHDLQALGTPQDDYPSLVIDLVDRLEAAAKTYDKLVHCHLFNWG